MKTDYWRTILATALYLAIMAALLAIATGRAPGDDVATFIFTTRTDTHVIRTVARTDGICPVKDCDSTVRVETRHPQYPSDKTYRAITSIRSTGQIEWDPVPLPRAH